MGRGRRKEEGLEEGEENTHQAMRDRWCIYFFLRDGACTIFSYLVGIGPYTNRTLSQLLILSKL